jgi:hypothetical protein
LNNFISNIDKTAWALMLIPLGIAFFLFAIQYTFRTLSTGALAAISILALGLSGVGVWLAYIDNGGGPIEQLFPPEAADARAARGAMAVAAGKIKGQIRYFPSPDFDNENDARRVSERMCSQSGATDCQWLLTVPTGECGAIAVSTDRRTAGRASLPDSVNTDAAALMQCQEHGGAKCDVTWSYCYPGADQRAFPRNRTAITLGTPLGASKDWEKCKQSHSTDEAIAACTRIIKSGTLQGTALAQVYFYRSARWMAKGNTEQWSNDVAQSQQLDSDQSFAASRFEIDKFGIVVPKP